MSLELSPEAAALFARAQKELLLPGSGAETLLDRHAIEKLIPHRDPLLLVDRVTTLDLERGAIAARYDLKHASAVFAGHFPQHPVWPGVLQVEAIAQAGLVLHLKREEEEGLPSVALTHVLGARFMKPVVPGGELEIFAQVLEEGLFFTIVGQCVQGGRICSAAAVSGV